MSKQSKKVNLVICTLDRREKLETCLNHIRDVEYSKFNVILIDSGDDSDIIEEFSDLPIVYENAPAEGLPSARNRALEYCDGDIISFIDDDAYVQPNFLSRLVAEFQDESVGGVGGPVLDPDAELRPVTPVARLYSNGEIVDNFDSSVRSRVDHLRGANMHYRRSILDDLGGFDEGYGGTAHFEDTDMSHRVKRSGWDLVYSPAIPVVHDHGFRGGPGYWKWRLKNWPRLYKQIEHSSIDSLSFWARLLVRWFYYSVRAGRLIRISFNRNK